MPKLNQILAIEKGIKNRVQRELTDLHKDSQKAALYEGKVRVYSALDEDGEKLPQEEQIVQLRAEDVLSKVSSLLTELFDIAAAKDVSNLNTMATVVVDNKVLVDHVPVSYLLFLEKQLNDVETFVSKLPTLDSSVRWSWSDEQNCYVADMTWTNRTNKVTEPLVLYPATDKHPAQTQMIQKDVIVGRWNQTRYSGALPVTEKEKILSRVVKLKNAVKQAREEANAVDAVLPSVGKNVFEYLFD